MAQKRPILRTKDLQNSFRKILYRPFDIRWIVYDTDIVDWPRLESMEYFSSAQNFALLSPRMTSDEFSPLVSAYIISNKTASRYDQSYFFPLYIYPKDGKLDKQRRVNFSEKIARRLVSLVSGSDRGEPTEVDIFDYVYGVLHSPAYRSTFKEFLRIDFPRIPWPANTEEFWVVAEKGGQLRRLHLMEPAVIGDTPFPFQGKGDNVVEKSHFENRKVWINKTQHFENIPDIAYNFHIGGYQPAQKWLKDRKGRELSFEDILHYQKIIKILSETDRIMRTIEMKLDA